MNGTLFTSEGIQMVAIRGFEHYQIGSTKSMLLAWASVVEKITELLGLSKLSWDVLFGWSYTIYSGVRVSAEIFKVLWMYHR